MYKVRISIEQGRGVPAPKFLHERNTYVAVRVKSQDKVFKTRIAGHSLFPKWNADFEVTAKGDEIIVFEFRDYTNFSNDHIIGTLCAKVESISMKPHPMGWVRFKTTKQRQQKLEVMMELEAEPFVNEVRYNPPEQIPNYYYPKNVDEFPQKDSNYVYPQQY